MAITVCGNCIDFGSQSICVDPAGIYVSGRFDVAGCTPTIPFQGSVSGYAVGGSDNDAPPTNLICQGMQKFPFTADSPSSDFGELARCPAVGEAGLSSTTDGYTMGGIGVQKFPFASDTPSSCIGGMSPPSGSSNLSGMSNPLVAGYAAGGSDPSEATRIYCTPFVSDSGGTCVGSLCLGIEGGAGHSAESAGFTSGGRAPPNSNTNSIQKMPFANQSATDDTACLTTTTCAVNGNSSSTHGYSSGGGPGRKTTIEKFPFSSGSNATDVGELTQGRDQLASTGQSSTNSGYTVGGNCEPLPTNRMDKFPFSADAPSSDIGNLALRGSGIVGQQF